MVTPAPSLTHARPDLRLLVFDLDGTLIDSRLDLAHSVNAALGALGRPALPVEQIVQYVGNGAPMLMRRALMGWARAPEAPAGHPGAQAPADPPELPAALAAFLEFYDRHLLDHTRPYPGVASTLERLRPHFDLAVLTNKPLCPSRKILAGLGLAEFFRSIGGGDSFPAKKPDPVGLLSLMNAYGALPRTTLMIGDSGVDILTGRNAGARTCGVTYGLAPETLAAVPADYTIHRFEQLVDLLISTENG